MPLTKEQEAQLAELQAEAGKPEPRTETGVAGVLHTLLDVVSGNVPHLAADAWVALHSAVEHELGNQDQAEQPAEQPKGTSSSGGKSSGGKS